MLYLYMLEKNKTAEPHDLYDLAFKRLMRLSNTAVINFINGLFGEKHPLTSKVEYFSTENVNDKLKKTQKDMVLGIDAARYIMEIQRRDDTAMPLRIFIYSYNTALDTQHTDAAGVTYLDFPKATVIYLENTGKKAKTLQLCFPDKTKHTFTVPVFNLLEHSIPDLEKQNLQLLLPFYVLKLHDRVQKAKTSDELKSISPELIELLKEIDTATGNAVVKGGLDFEDTRIIIGLLDRVYNHLYLSYNELQEANKMAEQILELRTDKIVRELELRVEKVEQATRQEERQKAAYEKQAITANLRSLGLNDDQISRALNVQPN